MIKKKNQIIDAKYLGLKQEWELHIFAVFYGFNLGSIQSFSRALMSTLTPPGHESEFFGFFEISDKGTNWQLQRIYDIIFKIIILRLESLSESLRIKRKKIIVALFLTKFHQEAVGLVH